MAKDIRFCRQKILSKIDLFYKGCGRFRFWSLNFLAKDGSFYRRV